MASLKDLIVHGTSKFISNIFGNIIHANKFITNGGTSSQFVKGDGTLDDSTYLTSATTPQYTITKLTTAETGYIASYELKKDGTKVGNTINIPKDYLVKSGTIETVTTSNVPYQGAVVGDKYLDFVVNTYDTSAGSGTTSHIYIPVNDLVDVYTKGNGIDISVSNIVSVKIDSNNANGLSVDENGLSLSTATTTSSGAMSSTDKSKLDGIASGAEVNVQSDWNQTNTGADDYIKNKPNIGSLKTDNTTAQTTSSSESFTGDINLHKISKTGSYNDLNDKPTIPSSGDFVTSLGTSGNNVTWTKNGVTNNLTVPYATAAGSLTSLSGLYWADIQLQNSSNDTKTPTFGTGSKLKYVLGERYPVNSNELWASPVPKYYWHDLFAFGRGISYPKMELSTDGTVWAEADSTTVSKFKNLFICKENINVELLNDTHPFVRFTWSGGICYSNLAQWLLIGTTYNASQASCTIVKEDNNADGTLSVVSTTELTGNSRPHWIKTSNNCVPLTDEGISYSGYNACFFRITFSRTSASGTKLSVSSIKYLTYRWGDQGCGSEYENPYDWNASRDILPIVSNDQDLGASTKYWKYIYASKFIKSGGTSSQFLKADGSVDSNTYATTNQLPSLPLSIENGGTGATTAKGAEYNINGGISEVTTVMTDNTQISMKYITPSTTNGVFYYRTATQIWDYIKSKIESILGIGGYNGVPTAPTASAGTNTTQIATTAFVNTSISNKADKVSGATNGNFAGLDTSGNLTDSGSKASDFATSTHTHGNITNTGALQTNDITIASGDKLVVTDTSNSGKIARTSISFDGTTTNTALTPKGTFERFLQSSDLNTYWANQQLTSEAVYNTEPEFKTVTINGSTNSSTASTENGVLLYDTEEKCIKFMFN